MEGPCWEQPNESQDRGWWGGEDLLGDKGHKGTGPLPVTSRTSLRTSKMRNQQLSCKEKVTLQECNSELDSFPQL